MGGRAPLMFVQHAACKMEGKGHAALDWLCVPARKEVQVINLHGTQAAACSSITETRSCQHRDLIMIRH